MVFSSIEFLLGFLPVFLLIYYLAPVNFKNIVLFAGSLFFYAYGEPRFVLLLFGSMIINYWAGRAVAPGEGRREWLRKGCFLGILIVNVAVLAVFKWAPEGWGLPLGVSFYTFQIISYLADVYRGEIPSEHSFLKLGTYICMFPQLVAGPIVNYSEVSGQLERPEITAKGVDEGLKTFVFGLVMKVLIADRLSLLWREIATIGYISISTPLAWMGALSYSMQIYFDFYGYSLMAIGLGKMLGYRLPVNFRLPYMAGSIRDFYRRWHMTLGRWFTKYVYIPLGGSRKGLIRTLFNLLIVWILTSLWHGGSLNFLIWGMSLCFLIMAEKTAAFLLEKRKDKKRIPGRVAKAAGHVYVLAIIPVTWMCFAISGPDDLGSYLGRMFGLINGIHVNPGIFWEKCEKYGLTMLIAAVLCTPAGEKLFQKWKDRIPGMVVLAGLFWVCVRYILVMGDNPFMYFRF